MDTSINASSPWMLVRDAFSRSRVFVTLMMCVCIIASVLSIFTSQLLLLVFASVCYGYIGFVIWELTYTSFGAARVVRSLPLSSKDIHYCHWLIKFALPGIAALSTMTLALIASIILDRTPNVMLCALSLMIALALMGMNLAMHSVPVRTPLGRIVAVAPALILLLIFFRPVAKLISEHFLDFVLLAIGASFAIFGFTYLRSSDRYPVAELFQSTWGTAPAVRQQNRRLARPPRAIWRGPLGFAWSQRRGAIVGVLVASLFVVIPEGVRTSLGRRIDVEVLLSAAVVLMPLTCLANLSWQKGVSILKMLPISARALSSLMLLVSLAPVLALWSGQYLVLAAGLHAPHIGMRAAIPVVYIQLLTVPILLRYPRSVLFQTKGIVVLAALISAQYIAPPLMQRVLADDTYWLAIALLAPVVCWVALRWTHYEVRYPTQRSGTTYVRTVM